MAGSGSRVTIDLNPKESFPDLLRICWVAIIVAFKYSLELSFEEDIISYALLFFSVVLTMFLLLSDRRAADAVIHISLSSILIILICISLTFIVKDPNFIFPIFAVFIFPPKKSRLLIKTYVISSSIFLFLIIAASALGLIANSAIARDSHIRYTFGFVSPNSVFMFYLPIALGIYYLYQGSNLSKTAWISILVTSVPLYLFTDSRGGFTLIVVTLAFWAVSQRIVKMRVVYFLLPAAYFIMTILSVAMAYLSNSGRLSNLSLVMTGRPIIWYRYLQTGISLLNISGDKVIQSDEALSAYGTPLDNFYLYVLVQLGLLVALYLGVIYFLFIKKIQQLRNYKLLFVILIFFLYGLVEGNVLIPEINWTLLLMYSPFIWKEGSHLRLLKRHR